MFAWLKKRQDRRQTARKLYGSIVTQARQPVFYVRWGVPDTVKGRFEMIVLHLVLAMRRLAREGPQGRHLAQALTETFVTDLDDTMREMTVGDMGVPRRIKRAVAALYQRHEEYGRALAAPDCGSLRAALLSQLTDLGAPAQVDADSLSAYMKEAEGMLAGRPAGEVLNGHLAWPQPFGPA